MFEAPCVKVKIEPHPDADKLELASVSGYNCIVGKGQFKTDDYAVYIPENSVVPDDVLEELELTGRLAGSKKNRVKAIKLRGVLSQGILYPATGKKMDNTYPLEGCDYSERLGITKYEPAIPASFSGKVRRLDFLLPFKVENIQNYPDLFKDGEEVTFTEKLHGTLLRISHLNSEFYISSKGMGAKGLVFTEDGNTVYHRVFKQYETDLAKISDELMDEDFTVFAEVYGKGVQDLQYGSDLDMRVFDIYSAGEFMSYEEVGGYLDGTQLEQVPLVYWGKFSQEKLKEHTGGDSRMPGAEHIREGIVIRPVPEREHKNLGRVILKSKSEAYLLRGSGTEFE